MAIVKKGVEFMHFDRSAHAHKVTWAIISNHCHRSAGWVRAIGVDCGHSNRNKSETAEDFRKPVEPSCIAIVKLSVGMPYVNKGSKWRKIYAIKHKRFFDRRCFIVHKQKKQDTRAVSKTCYYCIYRIHS